MNILTLPLDVRLALQRIEKDSDWLNALIEKCGFTYKNQEDYESLCRFIICKARHKLKGNLLILRLVDMSDSQHYPYDIFNAKQPEGRVPIPEIFFDISDVFDWCISNQVEAFKGMNCYKFKGYKLYLDSDYYRYF